MTRTLLRLRLALLLLVVTARGVAAEEPSKWEFEAELYGWIPGNHGTATVKGNTVKIDVSPNDALQLLWAGDALAAAGYFSVRYDRFSLFADSFGGFAKVSVDETIHTPFCDLSVDARDKATFAITDFGIGYRVGQWPLPGRTRPFTLGVYAGTRYVYFHNSLRATGGVVGVSPRRANVSESFQWADPLLGVRWELPVLDRLSATFRADIGGFGASSDLTWGLVSDLRYWLEWNPWALKPYLAVGYRVVAFDRSAGVGSIDLQLRGPLSGLGFVF